MFGGRKFLLTCWDVSKNFVRDLSRSPREWYFIASSGSGLSLSASDSSDSVFSLSSVYFHMAKELLVLPPVNRRGVFVLSRRNFTASLDAFFAILELVYYVDFRFDV